MGAVVHHNTGTGASEDAVSTREQRQRTTRERARIVWLRESASSSCREKEAARRPQRLFLPLHGSGTVAVSAARVRPGAAPTGQQRDGSGQRNPVWLEIRVHEVSCSFFCCLDPHSFEHIHYSMRAIAFEFGNRASVK